MGRLLLASWVCVQGIDAVADVSNGFSGPGGHARWGHGVVASDGAIYALPLSADSVLKIDPITDSVTTLGAKLGGRKPKWAHGVLAKNGAIYGVPYSASAVLKVYGGSVTTFGDFGEASSKWAFSVVSPAGVVYGLPSFASAVLRVDPTTDRISTLGDFGVGGPKWLHAVVAKNGATYGIPYSAQSVLKLGAFGESVQTLGNVGSLSSKWRRGVLAPNGLIYAVPAAASSVLQINPMTDSVRLLGSFPRGGLKWLDAVVSTSGDIYGLPYSASAVLHIQPSSGALATFGELGSSCCKWGHGVATPGGAVYGIPDAASAVLMITADAKLLGSFGAGEGKWTAGVLAGGAVYGIPGSADTVLKIDAASGIKQSGGTASLLGDLGNVQAKWGDGFVAASGAVYAVPRSAAAVLRIRPGGVGTFGEEVLRSVACTEFVCEAGTAPRPDWQQLTCRQGLCDDTCCVRTCQRYRCPWGFEPRHRAGPCPQETCTATFCCSVDVTGAGLALPALVLLTLALICTVKQLLRCRTERIDAEARCKLAYFAVLFIWDACDQTASWWFVEYAVAASPAVRALASASAMLGSLVVLLAFFGGLVLRTRKLLEFKLPELAYSAGAALADVLMLVAVFAFEMQGQDTGGWIKLLNLIATIIDFVLKVAQAAGAFYNSKLDDSLFNPLDDLDEESDWE